MKESPLTRKQFISILATASAAALLGIPALKRPCLVKKSRICMGTLVNLTLVGKDRLAAEHAVESCLQKMAELEQVLSRHLPASQLSQLNNTGSLLNPHPALRELIIQAREISELSGGAFDISIKPLQELYQVENGTPDPDQILDALQLVDYRKLFLDTHQAYFGIPGMSITLDGIAKGYIVDQGVQQLKKTGFGNVLVEAGGDLAVMGKNEKGNPWKVGIQDPRGSIGQILTGVEIEDQSLATSGDYLQSYTKDLSSHHILDPRTGHSSPDFASVSVSATSGAQADGLATAVMALGQPGIALIEKLANCEAYTVGKNGQIQTTSGFKKS